ncbi:hypothetical protein AMECASPLE_011624 [Ameca splendens]|uniref:Uncharacterized protein n=2 Tax=Goodeidae TaxID=28758 RepID=A0ABV1AAB8_9TELE
MLIFEGAVEQSKVCVMHDQISLFGSTQSSFLMTKQKRLFEYYFPAACLVLSVFPMLPGPFYSFLIMKGEHSFSLKSETCKSRGLSCHCELVLCLLFPSV